MRYTRTILLIAVLVLALTTNADDEAAEDTGPDIMCYECNVADNLECISLNSFKARGTFLKACKKGCAVRLGEFGQIGEYDKSVTLARGCDDLEQCDKSSVNCCKCDYDGCNINNYCSTANTFHPNVVAAIVFCTIVWNCVL